MIYWKDFVEKFKWLTKTISGISIAAEENSCLNGSQVNDSYMVISMGIYVEKRHSLAIVIWQ